MMNIHTLISKLKENNQAQFYDLQGNAIPLHAHLTEMGTVTRRSIDCGGNIESESKIIIQLWAGQDIDHRLSGEKLADILHNSMVKLNIQNLPVEIEYQHETIGRYDLQYRNGNFYLLPLQTACKPLIKMAAIKEAVSSCCTLPACCA